MQSYDWYVQNREMILRSHGASHHRSGGEAGGIGDGEAFVVTDYGLFAVKLSEPSESQINASPSTPALSPRGGGWMTDFPLWIRSGIATAC